MTADIDSSRVERVEDHYDPKSQVLRSEERNVEHTGEGEVPVAGVLARSRIFRRAQPKDRPAADGGAPTATTTPALAAGVTRDSHTRNFEVDHVTEKRIVAGGVLRRLTVAVVIDGTPMTVGGPARSKEDVEKIASLVRSAVGFDEKRGDNVTVEAVPFPRERSRSHACSSAIDFLVDSEGPEEACAICRRSRASSAHRDCPHRSKHS